MTDTRELIERLRQDVTIAASYQAADLIEQQAQEKAETPTISRNVFWW